MVVCEYVGGYYDSDDSGMAGSSAENEGSYSYVDDSAVVAVVS